jgi:hypothetical protein
VVDRTVTVRLEADISDFVSDIGVKAVAAVKRLESAATKADGTLKKTATTGGGIGDGVAAGTTKATAELDKMAAAADKTMTTTGTKVRKTAKEQFSKAGEEASKSFGESAKKGSEKAGGESGKAFGSGFKKWLTGGGATLGKSGASVFGSGFLGALKTPILGPAIVAILTAAILTAMPAVGAVAGGALVTGFGAGLAGLGLVFAAKSDAVGAAWKKTLGQLGADMQLLSHPFDSTLIHIASYFQRTVDRFNPALSKSFSDMAGPVDHFVDDFSHSMEQLIPAIGPVTQATDAVLAALGPAFESAIGGISDSLTKLANDVEQNPQALADFVKGLGDIVATALDLIRTLNEVNTSFTTLTGGTSLVAVVMAGLGATMAPLITLFAGIGKGIDLVNAALGRTGKDVDGAGQSMSDAAINTADLAKAHGDLAAAAHGAAPPVKTVAERVAEAKQAAADAKQKFEDLISAMFRFQGLALSLSGAQISFQQAIDDATKSVKENGRTLDINTEKGRNNKKALDQVASSANAQTEAMIRGGKSHLTTAATAQTAREAYVKLAIQMGRSKAEAEAMAKKFITIPPKIQTDFKADITDLDKKLASARKQLADPNLTATKRAKLQAEISQLLAAKARAQAAIDSLTGKTVAVTLNTYKNLIETHTVKPVGVLAPPPKKNADGGYYPSGIPSYADGKLPGQAMVAQGKGSGLVQWAEQSTGGEAFIPLAPSKRDRSTMILGQVANSFGMGLVKSFASGGINLPGGRLVDIALLIRQMGAAFNPLAGINYARTLAAQNKANAAAAPSKAAATRASNVEAGAKAQVAQIQRAITLQQRHVAALRKAGASDRTIAREQKETIALQDKLYRAKQRVTAATKASNAADAVYKIRAEAAKKATEAHAAAVAQLVEQQKAAVDFADQIAQSLTGGANIGDLFAKSLTGKGLLADLQNQGAQLAKFKDLITQLRKQGLSEDLIQQIVGKGAGQGTGVAQAILSGGLGLVAALNKAQKALDDQANLIGAGSAVAKYGKGVAGARAGGGDVSAGMTYRINEKGQEFFTAPINGHVIPANVDPNRYIGSLAGGSGSQRVVREVHNHQHNTFNGVSMAEADLIAQRANAKADLINRGY